MPFDGQSEYIFFLLAIACAGSFDIREIRMSFVLFMDSAIWNYFLFSKYK